MTQMINLYGNGFLGLFTRPYKYDDLVRLFRTEYRKEYDYAQKSGADVNSEYVKRYLKNNRK